MHVLASVNILEIARNNGCSNTYISEFALIRDLNDWFLYFNVSVIQLHTKK